MPIFVDMCSVPKEIWIISKAVYVLTALFNAQINRVIFIKNYFCK